MSDLSAVTHSARRTCNDAVFFSRDQKRLRERRRFLDAVCIAAAWLQGEVVEKRCCVCMVLEGSSQQEVCSLHGAVDMSQSASEFVLLRFPLFFFDH